MDAWMAYYADWSAVVIFATEIECLRYAVENHMEATSIVFGLTLREQT